MQSILLLALLVGYSTLSVAAELANRELLQTLNCDGLLKQKIFIDVGRMRAIRAEIKGERGTYFFPDGVSAVSFESGVSICLDKNPPQRVNYFCRGPQHPDDHEFIFRVISARQMRNWKVLDFPSGTGEFVKVLRASGVDAYGADSFQSRKNLESGYLFPGSFTWTPFQSKAFDLIFSLHGPLNNKTSRFRLNNHFQEIRRILKPGGKLLIGFLTPEEVRRITAEISLSKGWQVKDYILEGKGATYGILSLVRLGADENGLSF